MIMTIIIDDEENNIANLSGLLSTYCKDVQVMATATNAEDGMKIIQEKKPELVFLDIQMPGKTGFEMLASLSPCTFEVIFVTAFDRYGILAIKFSAIDYLLKPIDIEELITAVGKVAEKTKQKKHNLQLENLIALLEKTQNKEEHTIALPFVKETRFVRTGDIVRCESSNSYTGFYLANREKITISKSILECEELLTGYHFIRCHQSHLVNKKYITSWVKTGGDYLLLEDKTKIPVSRHRRDYVKDELTKK